MASERDLEFDAISEKEIFEEGRDRLQIVLNDENDNRNQAKEDLRFREGYDHWNLDGVTTESEEQPQLTINLTDALCQRVENNIKQQRPRGKAHPVGDGADLDVAQVINGIGRHVETRSEASVAYDQAARSSITNGWGYFRLIAEYVHSRTFQKDLRIMPIRNVFTVYMDPTAIMPHGADQDWCLLSILMKRTEYRRRYPRSEAVDWVDIGRDDHQRWDDKESIRLAEYFRIREKEETLYGLRNLNTGEEHTRFESEFPPTWKVDGKIVAPQEWTIDGTRDSARRAVEWFELNGLKVMRRAQLPGQFIPVFRVEGNATDIDGRIYRRGMVRAMSDPQRMVDYGEVAKIRRLALTPQSPWVMAEGQPDGHPEWNDAHRSPYVPLVYKPVVVETSAGPMLAPPPQRQPPAGVETGFAEFVQGMRTNLLAVAGMPNEPGADMQGQVVSGKAIQRRQGLSDQSHYQYYDNLTLAIAQCWRVMTEWIPIYFPEKGRIQRIIGEDSTPQMVKLNEPYEESPGVQKVRNDLSVGRYDVVMDTGPGYETKREEGADNLIELLKIQALAEIIAKVAPDLVFRSIDHPYMQEIADRLMAQTPEGLKTIMEQLPERARSVILAISNENTQLKQALQQAQLEQKYGIAKAHLAATVKAHDVEEDNKTKRLDTAVRAHTALAVEEIRAGSKILDTHVQAGHDAAASERMLERAETAESEG